MRTNQAEGSNSREEIIQKLNHRAAVYVPEWRIPDAGQDVGSVLTYIYADTLYQLGRQMNLLARKHKTEFFRCLDTTARPAAPARGYVAFDVEQELNQDQGTAVPAGTALTTTAEYPDETPVSVETEGDMELTPSTLLSIYESNRGQDYIGCLYEKDEENTELPKDLRFFAGAAENQQTHKLYLNHAYAFSGSSESQIEIQFVAAWNRNLGGFLAHVRAAYWSEDGWVPFAEQEQEQNSLILRRGRQQPPAAKKEYPDISAQEDTLWLCFTADLTDCESVELSDIRIGGCGSALLPNAMISDDVDSVEQVTAPFGDKFQIYNEWYIACDAALMQRGAAVQFHFTRSFVKTEINEAEPVPVEWKLVMKRGDIKVEKDYDITVASVIWEYYNGYGWTRLSVNPEYEKLFSTEDGTQDMDMTMVFICPSDMSRIHVGSSEAYYIRARILKVTNAFKTKGFYITPVLKNMRFDYEYGSHVEHPAFMILENNLESKTWSYAKWQQQRDRCVLWGTEDAQTAVYLGFDRRLLGGPLSLLFHILKQSRNKAAELQLEYHAGERWKSLNPVDETENLEKTGLVIFYGKRDMQKERLFGRERYWLRIRDVSNAYGGSGKQEGIWIAAIYQNAVKAVTVRSGREEFFMMNRYREHAQFQLREENVAAIDVWVRERWNGAEAEFAELKAQERIRETESVGFFWIKWQEKKDLRHAGAEERCYVLDHGSGLLGFGDGRHGRVPPVALADTIHAVYSVGGGRAANLPPETVDGLEESIGAVSRAYNPMHFQGGYDRETAEQAVNRMSQQLKHRNRAVTAADYEDLAFDIEPNVKKASCFSGYNADGSRQSGCLTLVLMIGAENNSDGFHALEEKLYREFRKYIPITVQARQNFFIIPPVYIRFHVSAELYLQEGVSSFAVRTRLLERLRTFFHPEHGAYAKKGWQVGQLPGREEIQALLTAEKSIHRMKNLIISCEKLTDGATQELSLEQAQACMYTLPLNGEHELIFSYE